MQTFLPYPDFEQSLRVLDNRRLGKQRVEALQIFRTITGVTSGWRHHPAVRMWQGFETALSRYADLAIRLWIERGFRNTMQPFNLPGPVIYPWWLGWESFHAAHRSNLLRKDASWYGRFGWREPDNLPYVWPVVREAA